MGKWIETISKNSPILVGQFSFKKFSGCDAGNPGRIKPAIAGSSREMGFECRIGAILWYGRDQARPPAIVNENAD